MVCQLHPPHSLKWEHLGLTLSLDCLWIFTISPSKYDDLFFLIFISTISPGTPYLAKMILRFYVFFSESVWKNMHAASRQ